MERGSAYCGLAATAVAFSMLMASPACADAWIAAGSIRAHPMLRMQPAPYFDLWYGDQPCFPLGACLSYQQFRAWERRRERERELSRPRETPPPMGIEAWHGWPGNAQRRLPEGDPANARAEYGESGTVQEQFERSGEFLPEFLDGSARPR